MQKTVVVETDDPIHPNRPLTISGFVETVYRLSKNQIVLRGSPDATITDGLTITPAEKFPFKVIDGQMQDGRFASLEWDAKQHGEKTVYRIKVANLRKSPGRYVDTIRLKTDSTIRPEIRIRVLGQIARQ